MTTKITINSPLRTLVRPLLGLAASLLLLGAGAEQAQASSASGIPYHEVGQWGYDSYGLKSNPPRSMGPSYQRNCRNGELVKWSPDLYRWNGSAWVLYNGSAPWYQAVTSSYGYCNFQFSSWITMGGSPVQFHRFGALPVGYYAIKHYMQWPSLGRTHADWSDLITIVPARAKGESTPAPPAPSAATVTGAQSK